MASSRQDASGRHALSSGCPVAQQGEAATGQAEGSSARYTSTARYQCDSAAMLACTSKFQLFPGGSSQYSSPAREHRRHVIGTQNGSHTTNSNQGQAPSAGALPALRELDKAASVRGPSARRAQRSARRTRVDVPADGAVVFGGGEQEGGVLGAPRHAQHAFGMPVELANGRHAVAQVPQLRAGAEGGGRRADRGRGFPRHAGCQAGARGQQGRKQGKC